MFGWSSVEAWLAVEGSFVAGGSDGIGVWSTIFAGSSAVWELGGYERHRVEWQTIHRTYLLELFHIDVELATKLGFGLRERRDLAGQLSRLVRFLLANTTLLLGASLMIVHLELLDAK